MASRPIILITGISGQVGFELARSLGDLADLRLVSRSRLEEFPGAVAIDLGDSDVLRKTVAEIRPDIIVNPAAFTQVDKAESEPELAEKINSVAPGILAEEAKKIGALLIHFSTDYVYSGEGQRPWKETDPTAPLNIYGKTKLKGEGNILETAADHIILRTSWVYSYRGRNFLKTMLRLGAEREALSIVSDQVGAPTSAMQLARVTRIVISKYLSLSEGDRRDIYGIYNVASDGETSWFGFAEEIFRLAKEMGLPMKLKELSTIETKDYPTPAARPLNSRLDLSKFDQRFGHHPKHWKNELADIMRQCVLQQ